MEEKNRSFLGEGGLKVVAVVVSCTLLNFIASKLMGYLDMPIYLDTIGTIVAAVLGGFMPGIVTAFFTNILNGYFDDLSVYYTILNAIIALSVAYLGKEGAIWKPVRMVQIILLMAFIGGIGGGVITWFLYGPSDSGVSGAIMHWLQTNLGLNEFFGHELAIFVLDLADKVLSFAAALLILRLIPQSFSDAVDSFGWQQAPMSTDQQERLKNQVWEGRHSIRSRVTWVLVVAIMLVAVAVTWVCMRTFSEYLEKEQLKTAEGMVNLAAAAIDPEMVDRYIEEGEDAPGYKDIEERLYEIRDETPDIKYVYIYKIEKNGCRVVFDLDTGDMEGSEPGDFVEFDKDFEPYLPELWAGKEIEPIVSNGQFGWLLTLYHPIYNSKGECVCYVAADISMDDLKKYENDFLIRIILVFSGFFVLILAMGIWMLIYFVILPINSMADCANTFAFGDEDTEALENNLKRIMELDIRTDDEIENLYHAFCKLTEDTTVYMENIERQAKVIDEMQKGLIITMADMVEGRDSDTGDHVQKTAAYADIILKGLKRKGYYTDQLTDKFVSDVVQSAPLHDIGKINVSDTILNKPGKITDEEFEIMKTHTTSGRDLLNKAISTVHGESYLQEGRNLATFHHEKWNGRGYPEGLSGEEIPLSARVMAVADVFDALVSKRVYKDAMPFDKAVSIIREDAGTHFDPKVVDAFLDSLDEVKSVLTYYNNRAAEKEAQVQQQEKEEKENEI